MNVPNPVALLVGLASCSASPAYDRAKAESEILEIERTWAQVAVTDDPSPMERNFSDDFVGITPDGAQYSRQGFIDDTRAHPLGFTSNELGEVKIRFSGNIAVAQGEETFTRKGGEQGRFVWTDVLERRDGRWQIIAAEDVIAPVAGQSRDGGLFQSGDTASARILGEIARTRNAYAAAWEAASVEQIADLYTDDAVVMYPNQPAVPGHGAIVAYFTGFFRDFPRNEFALNTQEVVLNGDWAFDRGNYRWKGTPRDGSAPTEDHGKYLVILRRQPDGRWKVARDIDNSDRAAAQASRGSQ